MIAETSLQTFNNLIRPNLTRKQQEVLNAAKAADTWTLNDLASYMGRFPNQISGRIGELIKSGKLEYLREENGNITQRLPKSGGERSRVFRVVQESIQTSLF